MHYKKMVPVTRKLVPETRNKNLYYSQSFSFTSYSMNNEISLWISSAF